MRAIRGFTIPVTLLVIVSLAGSAWAAQNPVEQGASDVVDQLQGATYRLLEEQKNPFDGAEAPPRPVLPPLLPSKGDLMGDPMDLLPANGDNAPGDGGQDAPPADPREENQLCAPQAVHWIFECQPAPSPGTPPTGAGPSPEGPPPELGDDPSGDAQDIAAELAGSLPSAPDGNGLLGALSSLLGPVEAAAKGATVAAKLLLGDAAATAHLVLDQTTSYAERQLARLNAFTQQLLASLLDLVPDADTEASATPDGAFGTSSADVAPVAPTTARAALALAAVGGLGLLALGFALARRVIALGGASLLSRIPSKDILKSDTRAAIFDIVTTDPGVSLNEIVARLGLSRNAVAYHLAVFESENQVVSVKDGKYRRYFVNGGKYVNGAKDVVSAIKNDVTLSVIRFIKDHPGAMQKEVCEAIGTSPSATNWHITRLERVGLVSKEKVANTVRYTPGPTMTKYDLAEFGLAPAAPVAA